MQIACETADFALQMQIQGPLNNSYHMTNSYCLLLHTELLVCGQVFYLTSQRFLGSLAQLSKYSNICDN